MSIYAVSDLHLSHGTADKGMEVFGAHWDNHWHRIKRSWLENVGTDDCVLIAGDISWAISYDEAQSDLAEICALPGKKIMIKGNHDFWHAGLTKTRSMLTNDTHFLQNDAMLYGEYVIVGTRGWKQPTDPKFSAEDRKIFDREVGRLGLSLAAAKRLAPNASIVCMMHYPPFAAGGAATPFTDMIAQSGCKTVAFGHIHGDERVFYEYEDVEIDGVRYLLTSCDYQHFKVKKVL